MHLLQRLFIIIVKGELGCLDDIVISRIEFRIIRFPKADVLIIDLEEL